MPMTIPSCGVSKAIISCLCYATCSTTLTLANKHIFSHELNYPWSLLGIQSVFVAIILIICQLLRRARAISLNLMRQMLLPCLLFTVFIFSNSQALRFVSLPVLSVIKSLAPMGIALVERAVFGDKISSETAISMFLIVVGNAVTMVNDMDYSVSGYVWALGNVLVNIAYIISLRVCLSDTFSPIEKAIHANMAASIIMLPLSFASGETLPFLQAIKETSNFDRFIYLVSCVFAAGIGISIFWVIQTTSGSTLSFVGTLNKFVVVILGGVLFQTRITAIGWISIMFGVLAGALFSVAKTRDSERKSSKETPDEPDENQSNDDGDYDERVVLKQHESQSAHDTLDIDITSDAEEDRVSEDIVR